jgi:hypothetical protein
VVEINHLVVEMRQLLPLNASYHLAITFSGLNNNLKINILRKWSPRPAIEWFTGTHFENTTTLIIN